MALYSSDGWVKDLASLKTRRYHHGCASYTDSSGQEVGVVEECKSGRFFF